MHGRTVIDLKEDWRFHLGEDFPAEVWRHGNVSLIANETHLWQKADNHGLSKPGNPHVNGWRRVSLPHDFVIEGEFTAEAALENGSLKGGVAWYLKSFHLPADCDGQRIRLEFDGVYRDSMVFCNGHFIGRHLSGYTSFTFDLSEVCHFGGDNVVAIRVDATQNELWSYEGGGIYRPVRLVITDPLHVAYDGVHLRTGGADDPGRVQVRTTLANQSYSGSAGEVRTSILDPDGALVAEQQSPVTLGAFAEATVDQSLRVTSPRLWSVDQPTLYRLRTELLVAGQVVDQVERSLGFRTLRFAARQGFFLNGVHLKLKGLCCHQDHAGVGVAVPAALQAWRVAKLKELGCNAIRTSHNPPDPALLDACDRLGMLVMDEIRLPGPTGERLADLSALIRRDRNHPSVILWSLGNEEMGMQGARLGVRILQRMQQLAHELDPDRLCTYAMNCDWMTMCDLHHAEGFQVDVFGANYRGDQRSENYDSFHQRYPDWPLIGTETMGSGSTRGLYTADDAPIEQRWLDFKDGWTVGKITRPFATAYGNWHTWWGYSIEETWRDCVKRPFMAGTFLWTGFDYRGETAPYAWPAVITRYGVLDYCGFYKEVAHYLRAWWRPNDPHIFLMPHWNWEGHAGKPIPVWCYSNARSIELFLNGRSLGRREMPENDRLDWDVTYEPGELKAVGYDSSGRVLDSTQRRTAGHPSALLIALEPAPKFADGEGIVVANVSVVDAVGNPCPLADNEVTFALSGNAELLGLGNGNPLSHEADKGSRSRRAYHGLCQAIIQGLAKGFTGELRVTAPGLQSATVTVGR